MYYKQEKDGSVSLNVENLDGFKKIKGSLPTNRNWRNAWIVEKNEIKVSSEKAKQVQRSLAISRGIERVEKDLAGNPKQSALEYLEKEIKAIDWNAPTTLDELYNTWPASIENRAEQRTYGFK